jgi:hypothetical protein
MVSRRLQNSNVNTFLISSIASVMRLVVQFSIRSSPLGCSLLSGFSAYGSWSWLVFTHAIWNKIHDIKTAYIMFSKQISRLQLLLFENSHQYIGTVKLHMENRKLQSTLEDERWLSIAIFFASWQLRHSFFNAGSQVLIQHGQIYRTCLKRFPRVRFTK